MHKPLDRASMIEAASRSLRHQLTRGGDTWDSRPRSKGSLHDASRGGTAPDPGYEVGLSSSSNEPWLPDNAQRRIRSAENQHRFVAIPSEEPHPSNPAPPMQSAATLELADDLEEVEEDLQDASLGHEETAQHMEFHGELKRPLSRKKDPSASAAAGLGSFSGPSTLADAFEQQKTRRPIPVESWGPRPPSRAGPPQKSTPFEGCLEIDPKVIVSRSRSDSVASSGMGRTTSKVSESGLAPSKVIGGTWAAARAEPRVRSEARRSGDRKAAQRGTPPSQQLSKSLSGVFDQHTGQFKVGHGFPAGSLEVNGCSFGDAAGQWPGSPPTRSNKRHSMTDAVSVEDFEADADPGLHGRNWRDAPPAQVIVTRSSQVGNKGRCDAPRGRARDRAQQLPFATSLDVDFLSLFAS